MNQFFRSMCTAFRWIGTLGFSLMAAYWALQSLTKDEVASRGGLWVALASVALAVLCYFVFLSLERWSVKRDQ